MVGNQILQPDYTSYQLTHLEFTRVTEVECPGSSGGRGGVEAVSSV